MTILHSSSGRPYCTTDARIQAVLPQLSDLRLVALTKQLSRNRKQLYLTQGNLATELVRTKQHIDREQKLSDDRLTSISTPYRKSLFHVRGVQKCLERRKTDLILDNSSKMFGKYGGLEVKSLKSEIDVIMKEYSYTNIKTQLCKKLLADSKSDGRIMNPNSCLPVLNAILNRPKMVQRREKPLGFDTPSPKPEPDVDTYDNEYSEQTRPHKRSFVLPPVKATRLFSPSKSKRREINTVVPMERAYTVI
ncbi:uncharacterized protein LOC127873281 [Dreissena polymorpha]|uniref:Uncharacterized protein n=1 Tax=Dreissena polymorpha TaxID=45954 RepID=A0A9D4QX98_DREPO|nr:uncharacterized protein LOC127873281 [Dreissena polymorpha]KAH3846328.1 hypothetical protein DPMN_088628 [Dreissena polymorpha]